MGLAIVVAAPGQSQAANLTSLVSFCTLTNCADGLGPGGGLIADADGNLFGTTGSGGAHGGGTVFEIAKTARGYASTPKILVRFCALANCADGQFPVGDLLADADSNLFGATDVGGAHGGAPEVIQDGVTGYVVQHGDTVQLATSIDALLSNPENARRMGEAGRQRVESEYRFNTFSKSFKKILRELCES